MRRTCSGEDTRTFRQVPAGTSQQFGFPAAPLLSACTQEMGLVLELSGNATASATGQVEPRRATDRWVTSSLLAGSVCFCFLIEVPLHGPLLTGMWWPSAQNAPGPCNIIIHGRLSKSL